MALTSSKKIEKNWKQKTSLTYQLNYLQRHNKDGGMATQASRYRILKLVAQQLKQVGFNQMTVHAIKEKHVRRLTDKWIVDGLNPGTIKNRMAQVRWWASKVNALHKIPSNDQLGIDKRTYISSDNKAVKLEPKHLEKVYDEHLKLSLRLQSEFGLRREEAIKFNASYAYTGKSIRLKDSWCKGKRSREIPITNEAQKRLISEIKQFTGKNSLIPEHKLYVQQMNLYRNVVTESVIGFNKGHGLRHNYAQDRYKQLSGNEPPIRGGKRQREMTFTEREKDRNVRLVISEELGHSREQVTSIYLGS